MKQLEELTAELENIRDKQMKNDELYAENLKEDFNSPELKVYREINRRLINEKNSIQDNISRIRTDLIEKKYANRIMYTDIIPYEVVEERTPNKYIIRLMDYKQTEDSKIRLRESFVSGGFVGHFDNEVQEWNMTSNNENGKFSIRRHKDGYFYDIYGGRYSISHKPKRFYDFNF